MISPEPWGKIFLSKHHYASFLSENHQVVFLNPSAGFTKIPFGNMQIRLEEIKPGLTQVSYLNCLPRLNNLPKIIRNWVYKIQVRRIKKMLNLNFDLVWSFDPRRYTDQRIWGARKALFHSVDLHAQADEVSMIQTSDVVVGVTERICDDLKKLGANAYLVTHGSHVDSDNHDKIDLPGSQKIKAVYSGNFHIQLHYELLIQLAKENSTCDFILIGPTESSNIGAGPTNPKELAILRSLNNVFFMGVVEGSMLHLYHNAADVCVVFYKKELKVHGTHKMLSYFASGKVVLSTPIEAYAGLPEELILFAEEEDYPNKFKEILDNLPLYNDSRKTGIRRNFAASHHYRLKIAEILGKLEL